MDLSSQIKNAAETARKAGDYPRAAALACFTDVWTKEEIRDKQREDIRELLERSAQDLESCKRQKERLVESHVLDRMRLETRIAGLDEEAFVLNRQGAWHAKQKAATSKRIEDALAAQAKAQEKANDMKLLWDYRDRVAAEKVVGGKSSKGSDESDQVLSDS